MQTLLIAIGSIIAFVVAYHTYGRWLARKIFQLDPEATVPSVQLNDNCDYVPTSRGIVFGHHFTSIAGTGPIVGPAIAIMWGWVPALLWVLFGSIFIGAVHDFGALVVSLRNRGQTVGDIAGRVINPRVRFLFLTDPAVRPVDRAGDLRIGDRVRVSDVPGVHPAGVPADPDRRGDRTVAASPGRQPAVVPSLIALALMYLTVWLGASCPGTAWEGGAAGRMGAGD